MDIADRLVKVDVLFAEVVEAIRDEERERAARLVEAVSDPVDGCGDVKWVSVTAIRELAARIRGQESHDSTRADEGLRGVE